VNATVREMQYCTNALAATPLMNIEVFLRFNIIDSLADDMHAARPRLETTAAAQNFAQYHSNTSSAALT